MAVVTVKCEEFAEEWDHQLTVREVYLHFGAIGRIEAEASDFSTTDEDHVLDPGVYHLNLFWELEEETAPVDEPMCRVCREGETAGPLFHPCKCSGSIKWVHEHCLLVWVSHCRSLRCELCHSSLVFSKVYAAGAPRHPSANILLIHLCSRMVVIARYIVNGAIWLFLLPVILSFVTHSIVHISEGFPWSFTKANTGGSWQWYHIVSAILFGILEEVGLLAMLLGLILWIGWCKDNSHEFAELQSAMLFYDNATMHYLLLRGSMWSSEHPTSRSSSSIPFLSSHQSDGVHQAKRNQPQPAMVEDPTATLDAAELDDVLRLIKERSPPANSTASSSMPLYNLRTLLDCTTFRGLVALGFFIVFSAAMLLCGILLPRILGAIVLPSFVHLWNYFGSQPASDTVVKSAIATPLLLGMAMLSGVARISFVVLEKANCCIRQPWVINNFAPITVARFVRSIATLLLMRFYLVGLSKVVCHVILEVIILPYMTGALLVGLLHPFITDETDVADDIGSVLLHFILFPDSYVLPVLYWGVGLLFISFLSRMVAVAQSTLRPGVLALFPSQDGVSTIVVRQVVRRSLLPKILKTMWHCLLFFILMLALVRFPFAVCQRALPDHFPLLFEWPRYPKQRTVCSILLGIATADRLHTYAFHHVRRFWSSFLLTAALPLQLAHHLFRTPEGQAQDSTPTQWTDHFSDLSTSATDPMPDAPSLSDSFNLHSVLRRPPDHRWAPHMTPQGNIAWHPPFFELRATLLLTYIWGTLAMGLAAVVAVVAAVGSVLAASMEHTITWAAMVHANWPVSEPPSPSVSPESATHVATLTLNTLLIVAWVVYWLSTPVLRVVLAALDPTIALPIPADDAAVDTTDTQVPEPSTATETVYPIATEVPTHSISPQKVAVTIGRWVLLCCFGLVTPYLAGIAAYKTLSDPIVLAVVGPVLKCPPFPVVETWVVGTVGLKMALHASVIMPRLFHQPWAVYWRLAMLSGMDMSWNILFSRVLGPVTCNLLLFLSLPYFTFKAIAPQLGVGPTTCHTFLAISYPTIVLLYIAAYLLRMTIAWWQRRREQLYRQVRDQLYLRRVALQNAGA